MNEHIFFSHFQLSIFEVTFVLVKLEEFETFKVFLMVKSIDLKLYPLQRFWVKSYLLRRLVFSDA